MELVSECDLPGFMKLFFRIGRKISGPYGCFTGQPFCLPQFQFGFTIIFLIPGLGSIGSSVIFQIQLTIPGWYMAVCRRNSLLKIFEIIIGRSRNYFRKSWHSLQMASHLQHITVHSAASVSVSVSQKQILIDLFIMVKIPYPFYRCRIDKPIICITTIIAKSRSAHKVRQYFRTIHSNPAESIVRHMIILVPANLDRHKAFNTGTLQDLRQGPAVTKYIRKPENIGCYAKLFFEKALTIKDLAYQSLTGRNITIRLYPHSSVWFPVTGFYGFLYPFINIRIIRLNIIIKLWLGLDKGKLRILLHQSAHR